ncbi:MAG: alcohol acetyltransferase [Spirochaetales bacterium]|nr:alcohol acetyltransferase [Spirochaetales bacterium]
MKRNENPQNYDFRLDNAAKLYPPLHSRRRTTMFRVAAVLDKPVRLASLEKAARHMMGRCPYYQVTLKRGLFWYYLEKVDTIPLVHGESLYPCLYIPLFRREALPFRIIAYKKRIAFETSHLLADGRSAMAFLNGLVLEYLRLLGEDLPSEGMVPDCRLPYDREEFSDSYRRNFERKVPKAKPSPKAAQLPGTPLLPPQYRILEGSMPSGDLKRLAGEQGVTIGVYLTALLLLVLCREERTKKKMKPVTITIPIDVRQFFPSKTMRNFMLTLEPVIDPRLGEYSFEEIVRNVHNYMQYRLDRNQIKTQIARNIRGESNFVSRIIPLFFKKPIMRWINKRMGEQTYTTSFSNLGRIKIPEGMGGHVEKYDFLPPRSHGRVNVTSLGYKGRTHVFFGSTIREKRVEAQFFAELRQRGVPVKISTNQNSTRRR